MALDSLSCRRRLTRSSATAVAFIAVGFVAGLAGPARAQSDECQALSKVIQRQGQLTQAAQSFGKRKMTPALISQACSTFGQLAANTKDAIAKLEKDGAWCHAPPTIVDALKASQPNIAKAQTNACNASANVKKMEQQARAAQERQKKQMQGAGPIGGGGDVLGGPIKVPQGAL
ncbi:MAG: hypothetical protein U1E62_04790 [Alsobacter sp.]